MDRAGVGSRQIKLLGFMLSPFSAKFSGEGLPLSASLKPNPGTQAPAQALTPLGAL